MHMEWNDMNAASTPYGLVQAGRAGPVSVSAARPRPAVMGTASYSPSSPMSRRWCFHV